VNADPSEPGAARAPGVPAEPETPNPPAAQTEPGRRSGPDPAPDPGTATTEPGATTEPAAAHEPGAAPEPAAPTEPAAASPAPPSGRARADAPSADAPSADGEDAPAEPAPAGAEAPPGGAGAPSTARRLLRVAAGARVGAPVTLLAIVLALVVGAVLIVLSNTATMDKAGYFFAAPGDFLSSAWNDIASAYSALFKGAIFDPATVAGTPSQFFGPITNTLEYATPLVFGGLSVSIAFRAGLFNIGGQGQTIIGAIFCSYAAFSWDGLPGPLHVLVAVVAGLVGGLLLGALVGWLKAWRGAHEVIVTIMLNYAAYLLLGGWLLNTSVFHDAADAGQAISKPADPGARLPHLFGAGLNTDIGLLIALAATAGTAWFLTRSKLGFELRAVGHAPHAARTAGIDVRRVQLAAMAIAGGMMGLIGVTQTLGLANPNSNAVAPNIDAGLGFSAITVALLGRTRPWGVLWASLLFGALQSGGALMQTQAQVSIEIITVVQALIVIFVAAPRLVQEIFRIRAGRRVTAGAVAPAPVADSPAGEIPTGVTAAPDATPDAAPVPSPAPPPDAGETKTPSEKPSSTAGGQA